MTPREPRRSSARRSPVLVVLAGLPGSGKSTIARGLAQSLGAAHVRIDSIEQAILDSSLAAPSVAEAGYRVGYAVARDILRGNVSVVADSVNPIDVTRDAWRTVARDLDASLAEIEVVCSDEQEHRRRVETRVVDVAGLRVPTWSDVVRREYQPVDSSVHVLDTAGRDATACIDEALAVVSAVGRPR
ncbi:MULTISPECIES: AAA family ATPase [Rhodococcus]|uniref:AAA family ATPase n=1 Tax=Rhodococcus opacus TaxID=37919 RepID=A0AAX3Y920_RHOOP|nr:MULTISPECIES: AAA family ATPase [Rhodococcus]MBA8965012.1 putative kinase [Rhodococcus opacus]MBP2208564.1 putative kinase [Rhodococcus opacus]MCZ4583059.1 AAA family ATPase [Rhodococcus opacus]MDI9935630.1 AAA family ATPase [Rhodococcus sp. IEGM 1351]MDX5966413.1 AAA family ATPase [Rhodococcus opacus]